MPNWEADSCRSGKTLYPVGIGVKQTRSHKVCLPRKNGERDIQLYSVTVFYQAGIPAHDIEIALEPEAASLYCRSMRIFRNSTSPKQSPKLLTFSPGSVYMVVDCGGE